MASNRKPSAAKARTAGVADSERVEARIRRWLLGALVVVGPLVLLAIYYKVRFVGLTNPDALDFAQLGRNLLSGRGFSTLILRPLALTHGGDPLHQPDLVHGPLFSLCLAIAFGALGAKDSICVVVSALFFLLTIPAVYLLGRRAFDHRVGVVSTLVFTISERSMDYATSGLHLTLCIFLATSLMLAVHHVASSARGSAAGVASKLPKAALAATGALAALLYLADPLFCWILPVVGAAVIFTLPIRRVEAAAWFLMPVALLAGPWMARNAILTGNPLFGLRGYEFWMNTKNHYPGLTAYRMSPAEVFAGPGLLQDVIRKVISGMAIVLDSWPQVGGNWVLVFFFPSLFFRFTDPAANSLRRVILYSLIALTGGMLLFQVQMPILVALVPGMLVFAVAYLILLIQQTQLSRESMVRLTTLLSAALLFPLVNVLTSDGKPSGISEREAAVTFTTASRPTDVAMSDQPWTVAWYSNRPAVLVPYTETKITDFRKQFSGLRWLFLSQAVGRSGPEWTGFYEGMRIWNEQYAIAGAKKTTLPSAMRVSGNATPLLTALTGFVTYPPLEKGRPVTLVAFAPPAAPGTTDATPAGRYSRP